MYAKVINTELYINENKSDKRNIKNKDRYDTYDCVNFNNQKLKIGIIKIVDYAGEIISLSIFHIIAGNEW